MIRHENNRQQPTTYRNHNPRPLDNPTPNLLNAYSAYKKLKHKNGTSHKLKGKENRKCKQQIRSEQFPVNAIKFKKQANDSGQIFTLKSKQSNESDKMLCESFGRHKQIQIEQNCKQNNVLLIKSPGRSGYRNEESQLCATFTEAVTKIFKGLDIFNRGRISETNINKWIPQSALYFLGTVFQKIRQQRLSINEQQFIVMCQPLLKESTEEDIRWFIEDVNGKEITLNVSIDETEESHLCESSPVQKKPFRLSNQHREIDSKKEDSPFNNVIQLIKQKEKDLNTRLQSIKTKQKQLPFVSAKEDINHRRVNSSSKRLQEQSGRKQSIQPIIPTFNYSIKREGQKTIKQSHKQITNFTFQIAQPDSRNGGIFSGNQQKKYENTTDKRRQEQRKAEDQLNLLRPVTSRIVRQNISTPHQQSACHSQRSSVQHESNRIDKLSTKLQQYILFNKQKIQRNRQFIRQNSTPKH